MNLWLRLFRVLLAALFGGRIGVVEASHLKFRVWPTDLDPNIHMNNARYLALMDLGRVDLLARSGLLRTALKRRWQPVLGGSTIRFRRPLRPFQRFTLTSRLVSWDDKWLYIEHRVETAHGLAAVALVKGLFVAAGGGAVPTADILAAHGPVPPVTPPPWAEAWRDFDRAAGLTPPPVPDGSR